MLKLFIEQSYYQSYNVPERIYSHHFLIMKRLKSDIEIDFWTKENFEKGMSQHLKDSI